MRAMTASWLATAIRASLVCCSTFLCNATAYLKMRLSGTALTGQ